MNHVNDWTREALEAEIDRLRAELDEEKRYSGEQADARFAAEAHLAAVITLCGKHAERWKHSAVSKDFRQVRAAATGDLA